MSSKAPRVRSTLAALVALAGLGGSAGLASATESSSAVVEIEADRFEPDRIEIEAGATIEWRNVATVARRVSADDGSFDSGRLRPGQSFVVSFAEPGEYPYHGAVGGRTPGTPAGLVVVYPPGTMSQEVPPPGEDPAPVDDWADGVDAEDPADLGAPPPSEGVSPPLAPPPPWAEGSDAPGSEAAWVPASTTARVAAPVAASPSVAVVGQAQEGVTIVDNAYQPKQIEVDAGTTVVWTQEGQLPHTVTADDGSFDSGEMGQGDTYSRTFQQPGSYPYYCTFHGAPGEGMAGTVVVAATGGPGEGADPGAPGAGEDDTGSTLADTGTSVVALSLVALALLIVGSGLLVAGRPRPSLARVPALTGFENLGPAPFGGGSA